MCLFYARNKLLPNVCARDYVYHFCFDHVFLRLFTFQFKRHPEDLLLLIMLSVVDVLLAATIKILALLHTGIQNCIYRMPAGMYLYGNMIF